MQRKNALVATPYTLDIEEDSIYERLKYQRKYNHSTIDSYTSLLEKYLLATSMDHYSHTNLKKLVLQKNSTKILIERLNQKGQTSLASVVETETLKQIETTLKYQDFTNDCKPTAEPKSPLEFETGNLVFSQIKKLRDNHSIEISEGKSTKKNKHDKSKFFKQNMLEILDIQCMLEDTLKLDNPMNK